MPGRRAKKPAEHNPVAPEALGARLRQIRADAGLSVREVASRAGLAHGAISQIERGKVSPAVGTLKKILDVFNISLSRFFSPKGKNPGQIFFRASELIELADGRQVSYRQVGPFSPERAIMILHERYAPGADTGPKYAHHAQEGGVVIAGKIVIAVGDKKRTLRKGDAYYFDSTSTHRFSNPFDEPCEIFSAVSPPTF